jgi:CRP-like cAMP-binding protein
VHLAWSVDVEAGETVVQRFDAAREFYVVVDGQLEVIGEGDRRLRTLGPGDFFGELAALDWGAGYGYPRLATVRATSPARLVALPAAALNEVLLAAPQVERRIRETANERLTRF